MARLPIKKCENGRAKIARMRAILKASLDNQDRSQRPYYLNVNPDSLDHKKKAFLIDLDEILNEKSIKNAMKLQRQISFFSSGLNSNQCEIFNGKSIRNVSDLHIRKVIHEESMFEE